MDTNVSIKKAEVSFLSRYASIIFFAFAFLLYTNTLGHDYTQDDAIVIYDNMFTQKGIQGYGGILGNDTFYGFFKEEGKAKLVSGGRYRPFTLLMFATEWEIFGRSPFIGHLINVILFGLLGVALFALLNLLFKKSKKINKKQFLAFVAVILFVCHPIHTEAVANIKGRDEIMTMLGSVIALWSMLKYFDTKITRFLIISVVSYFIALMSKENAITFLAVLPLSLYLFRSVSIWNSIKKSIPLIAVAIVFLTIRFIVLGSGFETGSFELMNNPFLKFENGRYIDFNFQEKYATIMYTLGRYISLLIIPHPLCHDYYPRAIDIKSFGDWQVIGSVLLYAALLVIAIKSISKHKVVSFAILFYLMTLSIVSNILFPIGTNMSERFLFMPSLGFTLLLAYILITKIENKKVLVPLLVIICSAFSIKTISRNNIWKDDFTLFTMDVNENTKSAKLLNAAGGALSTTASTMPEGNEKTEMLNLAVNYLNKAIEIHPLYRNAYLLLGNTNYYLKRYTEAINAYDKSLEISPGFKDVMVNLPIVLRDGAKHKGQVERDFATAEQWLLRSIALNPEDFETCRLLGVTYGVMGDHQKAIIYFEKALQINPESAILNAALGTAYRNVGDMDNARLYLNKAVEIDPNALNHLKSK